ncbi:inorganic triphosphatase [Shewanella maritima]|uniref:CYTH domain-containing protein n=1 Tax=Shewanella maritima TaxID=2520507 RepID=UPI003735F9F1
MDSEIELKLILPPQLTDLLIKTIKNYPGATSQATRQLSNQYFDSATLVLRQNLMGLRVRTSDNFCEQTLKTAGKVIGGIHSRPEYNVPIEQKTPDLTLFPNDIWPDTVDITLLNAQLECVFETNFTRQTWHIYIDDSLVEVAFDHGQVIASEQHEPICEVELELLAGDTSALLQLATEFAKDVPMRLGKASKAQRGYILAGKTQPLSIEHIDYICLPTDKSLDKTLTTLLETGLERWQLIESVLIETDDIAQQTALWSQLLSCVRLLKLTLNQFGLLSQHVASLFAELEQDLAFIPTMQAQNLILENDAHMLSKLGEKSKIVVMIEHQVALQHYAQRLTDLWQKPQYGQLQLALVELLLKTTNGQHQLVDYPQLGLFANHLQQDSWQRIVDAMPIKADMSSLDYQHVAQALDESILVGFAYGELYLSQERESFRAPWQDLALGIQTLTAYQCLRESLIDTDIDIGTWLDNKESSLVFAMEHSRKSALKEKPYW